MADDDLGAHEGDLGDDLDNDLGGDVGAGDGGAQDGGLDAAPEVPVRGERAARRAAEIKRRRTRVAVVAAAVVVLLVVVAVVALGGGDDDGDGAGKDGAKATSTLPPPDPNTVPFTYESLLDGDGSPLAKLADGSLDVGVLRATAPVPDDLVVLADDREARAPQLLVPVVRADLVFPELVASVTSVSEALVAKDVPGLVAFADGGQDPADVATRWLEAQDLLAPEPVEAAGPVRIGATGDVDVQIAAQAYGQALAAAKFDVTYADPYADDAAAMAALGAREVDLVVTDAGGVLQGVGSTTALPSDPKELRSVLDNALKAVTGTVLAPTDVDRSTRFVVTKDRAEELGLSDLSDLASVDEALAFGGPDRCLADPSCLPFLQTSYGLAFDL